MKGLYVALAVVLAVAEGKSLAVEESVRVQVYYESLCPYSIAFITTQLHPAFVLLGSEKINLQLIPWGHASEETVNGTTTFTCQHGPDECYGNKAHSCAIDLGTIEQSTEFVYCSENSSAPTDDVNLEACAKEAGIQWTDLQECLSSDKGDDLLSANGKRTALIQLEGVPTIAIDGDYSDDVQNEVFSGFQNVVCTLLGNPAECAN